MEGLGIRGEVRVWGFGFSRNRGYEAFCKVGGVYGFRVIERGPWIVCKDPYLFSVNWGMGLLSLGLGV